MAFRCHLSWNSAKGEIVTVNTVQRSQVSTGAKSRRRWRWREIEGFFFISPWLVGFLAFTLGPFIASFLLSFADWNLVNPPVWVGLRQYQVMFTDDPRWLKALYNTAYFTLFHVPSILGVAMLTALLLNSRVAGVGVFRTIFYLPSVTSGVAMAIVWAWIFNYRFGLVNQALALVGIQGPNWLGSTAWAKPAFVLMSLWTFGSTMVIYLAGLQGVPRELYEAGEIDGAGAWRKFYNITIPMMSPAIFFTIVMTIIGAFQVFISAFIMTSGGPVDSTLFYILYLFRQGFVYLRMGYACAMAWVLLVVIVALTAVQFRFAPQWVHYER